MLPITTTQARQRYTTLPPTLQDAVFSEQTAEIIAQTIEKFNLADHRAEDIPTLVGWVLLGFLHIEDLAAEIETAARVPKPVAKEIADSLTVKIFEPLRAALAQFHAPVPDASAPTPVAIKIEGMSVAPKIIGETTFTATPGGGSQKNVIIGPKIETAGRLAPSASDRSPTATPSSNLPQNIGKPIPHFEPKPNIGGAMAAPTAAAQKPKSTGEFARLATQAQAGGAPTPMPAAKPLIPVMPKPPTSSAPQVPRPVMLQNSNLPKPIQNAPILNNSQKAVDILAGKKMPVPLPMKPTVIEIGGAPKNATPPGIARPGASMPVSALAPRTANYDAMRDMPPAAPNRQITEITAAPQQPIKPPPKPAPLPVDQPKPQTQPQPQQQQSGTSAKPAGLAPIIVKNFKEGE